MLLPIDMLTLKISMDILCNIFQGVESTTGDLSFENFSRVYKTVIHQADVSMVKHILYILI